MPKKNMGINSKAADAKARKASLQKEKEDSKKKAAEDASWEDDDKHVNRKLNRKADAERKKEELAAKKLERDALYAAEMGPPKESAESSSKQTQAQISAERERREAIRREEEAEKQKAAQKLATFELEENVNRLELTDGAARDVDTAIRVLATSGEPEADRHPEKRVKNAWKAFEEVNMPVVRGDNPGLKMSQYRQMLRKEWDRSPQNPMNQQ